MTQLDHSGSSQRAWGIARRDVNISQFVEAGEDALPLVEPFDARSHGGAGPSRTLLLDSLRASASTVPLIGREQLLEAAAAWMREPPASGGQDHRVLVLHGPGGAGKTRLAAEILDRAAGEGWRAGFLSGAPSPFTRWAQLAHPSERTVVAVDYAEARLSALSRLLEPPPLGHEGDAPLRLILIVREGKAPSEPWSERLLGDRDLGARAARLLADDAIDVMSLEESLPDLGDRRALWIAAHASYSDDGRPPDDADDRSSPDHLANPLFERPLFVLLDAYRDFAGDGSDGAAVDEPPTAEELIAGVLKHERTYWRDIAAELELQLGERAMNQVAVVATLVGGVTRTAFEEALSALGWLRADEALLSRVADWWCAIYATESGVIRGVEPDIVGEYLVMRAMGDRATPRDTLGASMRAEQLTSLIESATLVGRQRMLRVLTRVANDEAGASRDAATALLSEILSRHLDEFLPAAFGQPDGGDDYIGVGESVATTVASAVLASDKLRLVLGQSDVQIDKGGADRMVLTARNAGLRVVRRQLQRVAERELEAERWSAERFADVAAWALRLDLEAGAEEQAEARLASAAALDPRPHRPLATMLTEIGRHRAWQGMHDNAERLLREASEELAACDDLDSPLAHAITHELAAVAAARGDSAAALELYEQALEGKTRVHGPAAETTVGTLLSLSWTQAEIDINGALDRLTGYADALVADGAPEDDVARVLRGRPQALRAAGWLAERERRLDAAWDLYERALEELHELGEQESALAYVLSHDLGDVAAAQGDSDVALRRFEHALEGKAWLRGVAHRDTVTTLIRFATELAKTDLDAAIGRLDAAAGDLVETDLEQLVRVAETKIELLSERRRFNEAAAVARELLEVRISLETRRAIFDAAADPVVDEYMPTPVAVDAAVLAGYVFPGGDPRLAPLASRLALLIMDLGGSMFLSQLDPSMVEAHAEAMGADGGDGDVDPSTSGTLRYIRESIPDYMNASMQLMQHVPHGRDLLAEFELRILEELGLAREDPLLASIVPRVAPSPSTLGDDAALRRWLIRTSYEGLFGGDDYFVPVGLGAVLSLCVGVDTGALREPPLDRAILEIWSGDPAPDVVARELERFAAGLQELYSMDDQAARRAAGVARSSAIAMAARAAITAGDPESSEATELLRRATEGLDAVDARHSAIGYAIDRDMAEALTRQGEGEAALELYERAFEGSRELDGEWHLRTITTLIGLTDLTAERDVDAALARLDETAAAMVAGGAPADQLERVRRGRADALHTAGRAAGSERRWADAESLYQRAASELEALGYADSNFAYVILHDLADVAKARGETDLALERYEQALTGKTRLTGAEYGNTISTLLALTFLLAERDVDAALARLDETAAALVAGRAPEAHVERVRDGRASALHAAGRAAERERRWDDAESLYQRATSELQALGKADAALAFEILRDLADVAKGRGDTDLALERYEQALTGKTRLRGSGEASAVATLLALVGTLAERDVDAALARLDETVDLLLAGQAPEEDVERVREGRATALHAAGRAAERERRWDDAESLYLRATSELEELGKAETALTFVILHDLADVARARRLPELALERYERALAGKIEVRGATDSDTITTLLDLATLLAERDIGAALTRLDEAAAALTGRAPEEQLERVRHGRARALHSAGRAAERERWWKEAETLYQRAANELQALGQAETGFAFAILHDLADVARGRGDRDLALERYEQALAGGIRVRPPTSRDTAATLLGLTETIAERDVPAAIARLLDATERPEDAAETDPEKRVARRARTLAGFAQRAEQGARLSYAETLFTHAHELLETAGQGDLSLARSIAADLGRIEQSRGSAPGP